MQGPIKSLKVHMENASSLTGGDEIYIFRWLSNQFDNLSSEENKDIEKLKKLTEEVIKYIPDLVNFSTLKTRFLSIKTEPGT